MTQHHASFSDRHGGGEPLQPRNDGTDDYERDCDDRDDWPVPGSYLERHESEQRGSPDDCDEPHDDRPEQCFRVTAGVHQHRLVTIAPQWLSDSHHVSSMDDPAM